jgi:hypothetical protein
MINEFSAYLQPGSGSIAAQELIQQLKGASLNEEAWALELFVLNEMKDIAIAKSNPWSNGKCSIGMFPPPGPSDSDMWFDAAELTPYLFVKERMSWFAIHPVYCWQYKGFLETVKFEMTGSVRATELEFLSTRSERIIRIPDVEYIRNIYHEEAAAYTKWFGKSMAGGYLQGLHDMDHKLSTDVLKTICPDNFNIWDGSEYPGDTSKRMAFNTDVLNYEYLDELEEMEFIPEKKVIYNEFETSPFVGISSLIFSGEGVLNLQPPFKAYDFVTLLNVVSRAK